MLPCFWAVCRERARGTEKLGGAGGRTHSVTWGGVRSLKGLRMEAGVSREK